MLPRVVIPAALLFVSLSPASAASPSLSLSSSKVKAGFGVTVRGKNFRPAAYVAIVFAYPKMGKHAYERFVGNAHTNASGTFRLQVQIPRLAACGRAMLYGQVIGTSHFVGKRVNLVGCKNVKPPTKPGQ